MRKTLIPLVVVLVVVLGACAQSPPAEDAAPPRSGPVLPFIADDYDAALAQARERDLPIFVDSWAPW